MRAILRFDQSDKIGAGHAVRSLALGRALEAFGVGCAAALGPRSDAVGLPGGSPAAYRIADDSPAALRAAFPDGCDILVVDSYALGAEFEAGCRGWARRIVAFDDAPSRRHDCDVLVDATPGRRADSYAACVGQATRVLAGPAFASLRPEFLRARHSRIDAGEDLAFVGFGASDAGNFTAPAVEVARAAGVRVRAVLGRFAPNAESIRARFAGDPHVDVLVDPPDMAMVMAQCTEAIGAAGVSALERCCLGLPSVAVPVVANQRDNADALSALGAAIVVEPAPAESLRQRLAAALRELANSRTEMADRAAALCDGYGAARIAAAAGAIRTHDADAVSFRAVTGSDADALLYWQRDPEIRRHSRNPDPPSPDGHARWLAARLADPTRLFEIASVRDRPAGVVRLDRRDPRDGVGPPCYEVSIFAVPGMSGNGVGKAMLAYVRAALPWARLQAEILPGNDASHALFSVAGYVRRNGLYFNEPIWNSA